MAKRDNPTQTGVLTTNIGSMPWRASGNGETLLFLHGLLTNASSWDAVIEDLARDFRCVTLDLPLGSHTCSTRENAELSVESLATAVCEAVGQLCPEGFVLIGSDTGGVVAQITAVRRPPGLTRLVLLSCDTEKNFLPAVLRYLQVAAHVPGAMQVLRLSLRSRWIRRLPIAFGWLVRRELSEREWDSIVAPLNNRWVRRDLGKILRGISTRFTVKAAEELESFPLPTLFLWADTRKVFSIDNAHALAARMPRARVKTVPDSLAFSHLDQPGYVSQSIRQDVKGDG
ncbi:alpha/beta hydrolase [Rothia sp. AR01]|uniref:Alpha/beta hydrolase n=1 Tax=Rothia santali TaxID=2949643 RepID=A0A9X2HFK4_9MICC|nr:alpha/beta hydrolase [Rothia santali]MCP3424831.1 alpha/beta hydrolase [Rothia santali]